MGWTCELTCKCGNEMIWIGLNNTHLDYKDNIFWCDHCGMLAIKRKFDTESNREIVGYSEKIEWREVKKKDDGSFARCNRYGG